MFQRTCKPSYLSYVISLISSGNHIDEIAYCWATHGTALFFKRLRPDASLKKDFAGGLFQVESQAEGSYSNKAPSFSFEEEYSPEYQEFIIRYAEAVKPPYWPKSIPESYRITKSKRNKS